MQGIVKKIEVYSLLSFGFCDPDQCYLPVTKTKVKTYRYMNAIPFQSPMKSNEHTITINAIDQTACTIIVSVLLTIYAETCTAVICNLSEGRWITQQVCRAQLLLKFIKYYFMSYQRLWTPTKVETKRAVNLILSWIVLRDREFVLMLRRLVMGKQ